MIQLLLFLALSEMGLILILLFKTPLRKLVILGLDRLKRGRGPIMVKTVGATVFVIFISSVYGLMNLKKRLNVDTVVNPTDQILLFKQLLEASLMGYSVFLVLMIDRLHHYMRELRVRRKSMEAAKKQNRAFDDGKVNGTVEIKALEEEVMKLQEKLKQVESELENKSKEADTAETNVTALKKQSEGLLLEYDRVLEENQNLRKQLQTLDRRLSHSGSKKWA
ncbi:hypothetical protein RJ641_018517 [Dillenia turbinata]|uniref:Endoplasmic reticulum transmembrane protein n=1 Tax=Dillenia turbinata TaxID=194707 RepID=A0AAN8UTI4_9MAGN